MPGFSVHGILQARILEWVPMPSSRGPSQSRDWTRSLMSPALAGGFFTISTTSVQSAQSLSHVQLFVTPCTAAHQASLSITNCWSSLRLMSIESVIPSNPLILCCPLLVLPSIFPSIRVFSNESALCIRWPNYWSCQSTELNMPANLENSAMATGLEKVNFHSNPKEKQC